MASNPVAIIAIIALVLTFEGLLFGSEVAEMSYPTFEEPRSAGLFGAIDALLSVVQAVWGTIVFVFNLLSFNIPGVPWYVQLPVASVLFGGLIWSIAELIRGN